MSYPRPPLNGFDKPAYEAHVSYIGSPQYREIQRVEERDGVVWITHSAIDDSPLATISRATVESVRYSIRGKIYRIRVNEHLLVRITTNPISFLANKTDHYIPEDCKVEFIPIPMREDT